MGQSTSTKITQQDKAILQVKLQRDKLSKYQRQMEYNIIQQKTTIKKYLLANDKNSAKLLMKRLKYQQKLSENVSDQVLNLENMIRTIEFKLIEREFLNGLTKGNDLLKKLNSELSIDKVENLIDDVRENIQVQEEIDAVLTGSVIGRDYNDEIEDELEALEKEISGKVEEDGPKVPDMPSVVGMPKIKNPVEQSKEEEAKIGEKRTALIA